MADNVIRFGGLPSLTIFLTTLLILFLVVYFQIDMTNSHITNQHAIYMAPTNGYSQPITGYLHTSGSNILQANGTPIYLYGINYDNLRVGGKGGECNITINYNNSNLTRLDINVARIPIYWENIEPYPPTFYPNGTLNHHWNTYYLQDIDHVVNMLTSNGVAVILDFHQDGLDATLKYTRNDNNLSKCYGGGFPIWIAPNALPQYGSEPAAKATLDFAQNVEENSSLMNETPWQGLAAVETMIAKRYLSNERVIGIDIINEPSEFINSTTGNARGSLNEFYDYEARNISIANSNLLIFIEDCKQMAIATIVNECVNTLSSAPPYQNIVYEFHYYTNNFTDSNSLENASIFMAHVERGRQLGLPIWLGEFNTGPSNPSIKAPGAPTNWPQILTPLLQNVSSERLAGWSFWDNQILFSFGSNPANQMISFLNGYAIPYSASLPQNTVVTPAYHVVGDELIGPNGQQFIPHGFIVYCLAQPYLCGPQDKHAQPNEPNDTTKIAAMASFWHANTVRIQVAQEHLFSQSPYNATYLNMIDKEVNFANSRGLVAIITLQEELYGGPSFSTNSSVKFWNLIAPHYANNSMVFFDLFNEPVVNASAAGSSDAAWNIWKNGGTITQNGVTTKYIGFQTLVNEIRAAGANNLIIAESTPTDSDLSGLPTYALTDPANNLAYGFEPKLTAKDGTTPAAWNQSFGNLSKKYLIMMEAFYDNVNEAACNSNSPVLVPELFDYLQSRKLGLLVYSLNPGQAVVGNNIELPTSYAGVTVQPCNNTNGTPYNNTIGDGENVLELFSGGVQSYPALSIAQPAPLNQIITTGQNATITDAGATWGEQPYAYQWLEEAPKQNQFYNATSCAMPKNTTCNFHTYAQTNPGLYTFELKASDSETPSNSIISSIATVTVTQENNQTSVTGENVLTTCGNWICLDGKHYIMYGVNILPFIGNVTSLGKANSAASNVLRLDTDPNLYKDIAGFWHGDSIRVQISSQNLFSQSPYNSTYLGYVDNIVSLAHEYGLTTILSLQYQLNTNGNQPSMPTQDSINFWRIIAAHYANDSYVAFDLFNEPYLTGSPNASTLWGIWQNGGTWKGNFSVGMQAVVNAIRESGSQNLVIAEGMDGATNLSGISTHMLVGNNIAYGLHPYFSKPDTAAPSDWIASFENPIENLSAPVVADEWSEWESDTKAECQQNGPEYAAQLLSFLQSYHVGLLGWDMNTGKLIQEAGNWTDPTSYDNATWSCINATIPQGPGEMLINYFKTYSIYPPQIQPQQSSNTSVSITGSTGNQSGSSSGSSGSQSGPVGSTSGGGGGPVGPVITNFTNYTSRGVHISNFSAYNSNYVEVGARLFHVTNNYITPTMSGITVNNISYTLVPGVPQQISKIESTYYIELQNISYIPILHTVSITIYENTYSAANVTYINATGTQITANVSNSTRTVVNFSMDRVVVRLTGNSAVSEKISLSVQNLTSGNLPILANEDRLSTIDISANAANEVTINLTMHYPSYVPSNSVRLYTLVNGSWTSQINYTINDTSDSINVRFTSDPIIGVFENTPITSLVQSQNKTQSRNVTTSNIIVTNNVQDSGIGTYWRITAIALALIVAAALLLKRMKEKRHNSSSLEPPQTT